MNRRTLVYSVGLGVCAVSVAAAEDETGRLHALFAERYAWEMRAFPETAMSRGDYSHADRITDRSLEAIARRHEETSAHLARLREIDKSALSAADRLNYALFERQLANDVETYGYRMFLAPVGPRSGPHQRIAQMGEHVRFADEEDYVDYLARLTQVPRSLKASIAVLRVGLSEGRTPPAVTLGGVSGQIASLLEGGLGALARPFDRMPESISGERRHALQRRFVTRVEPAIERALVQFKGFLEEEYIPHCRTTIAARDLPEGEAYYAFRLRDHTTTEMTAAEIHALGLSEVARIRAEMMDVIRASDFPGRIAIADELTDDQLFKAFVHYLRTDARFYHDSPQALLRAYRDICKRIDAVLPRVFVRLPRLPYGVREIPAFMAPTQTTAYYQPGDIRNREPGWFYANTYQLDQRPKYEMIALAMHEAVPGHHLQVSLAQEIEDVPEFRKHLWVTAFGEGWALYSERLGIEMGLYADPYDNFGRLLYEMWRACRLVVDTGMHALGWSRERAVAFMVEHTALSTLNIDNEIDRYISWPGQATAYKIGELKIRGLREEAEKRLGEAFDLRAFHAVVLEAGSIPLTILEERVHAWVAGVEHDAAGSNRD